jgi:tetratricopeptide (TPR) repeat protein
VADHFQYLASAALIVLLVALVANVIQRVAGSAKEMPYLLTGLVLVVFAVLTMRQASIYASNVDLWRDTAQKNPGSAMAHYNYGTALLLGAGELPPERADDRSGMLDGAMHEFARAVEINPQHEKAWTNWGLALLRRGKPDEAIPRFETALKIAANNLDALTGLGQAHYELKQYDQSLSAYRTAQAIVESMRPNAPRAKSASIFQAIGQNLVAKNDLAGAAAAYAQSIEILRSPQAQYEYALVLNKQGKKPEAALQLARAIRDQPDFIDARIGLAQLMMDVGNLLGAHEQLIAAARINKTYLPLLNAAQRWSDAMAKREATQPSTTRAATTRAATQPSK